MDTYMFTETIFFDNYFINYFILDYHIRWTDYIPSDNNLWTKRYGFDFC